KRGSLFIYILNVPVSVLPVRSSDASLVKPSSEYKGDSNMSSPSIMKKSSTSSCKTDRCPVPCVPPLAPLGKERPSKPEGPDTLPQFTLDRAKIISLLKELCNS